MNKKYTLVLLSLLLLISYSLFSMGGQILVLGIDAPSRNRTLPIEITIGSNFTANYDVYFSDQGDFNFVADFEGADINENDRLTLSYDGYPIYNRKMKDVLADQEDLETFENFDMDLKVFATPLTDELETSVADNLDDAMVIEVDDESHKLYLSDVGLIRAIDGIGSTLTIEADTASLVEGQHIIVMNTSKHTITAFGLEIEDDEFRIFVFEKEWRERSDASRIVVDELDFAAQLRRTTSQPITATIYNKGSRELIITELVKSPYIEDGTYSIISIGEQGDPTINVISETTPLVIDPGASKQITIAFIPPEAGDYTSQIEFISNTENLPNTDAILELHGTGFAFVPNIPTLQLPENGAMDIKPIHFFFQWIYSSATEVYTLEVATDSLFSNIVISEEIDGYQHYVTGTALETNMKYFWRVKATTEDENSEWSQVWNFTTSDITSIADDMGYMEISIIPNPASDEIRIDSDYSFESAEIYSVSGNLLLYSSSHQIDISILERGTYYVLIKTDIGIKRGLFIKE